MDRMQTRQGQQDSPDRIWVVEDDPDIGFVLEHFLNAEGYETKLLNTAKEFRGALDKELPDLLLMDVMLPDGNGVDLCQEVKDNERSRHIPILIMSAHASQERVGDCDAEGFIAKPFDLMRVLDVVREGLRIN